MNLNLNDAAIDANKTGSEAKPAINVFFLKIRFLKKFRYLKRPFPKLPKMHLKN